jgi:hypothetical protein
MRFHGWVRFRGFGSRYGHTESVTYKHVHSCVVTRFLDEEARSSKLNLCGAFRCRRTFGVILSFSSSKVMADR